MDASKTEARKGQDSNDPADESPGLATFEVFPHELTKIEVEGRDEYVRIRAYDEQSSVSVHLILTPKAARELVMKLEKTSAVQLK